MLSAFGTELYGVLSATWLVLGYFSWLDFGLSRASARFVARELAVGDVDAAASWAWTAALTQTSLGLAGALILSLLTPVIVRHLHVKSGNEGLVTIALHLFAFAIPVSLANRCMNGVLQAGQRFGWANGLNIVGTVATYVVYTIGILVKVDFRFIIYGLFLLKFVELVGSYWGATKVVPGMKSIRTMLLRRGYGTQVRSMIAYGSWITVASILGPLLLTLDQWMITLIIGVATLPYYTVPFNLLMRLNLLPSSLSPTLFPAFTALHARNDWDRIESYFIRAHRYLIAVLIPVVFLVFTWSSEILRFWVGSEFSARSTVPLQILVAGFAIALLAPVSGTLLEGIGRPDVIAKLYVLEVPLNIASVYFLTRHFGLSGAAWSYTLRAFVETILLWVVVYRVVPLSFSKFISDAFLRAAMPLTMMCIAAWLMRGARLQNHAYLVATVLIVGSYGFIVTRSLFDESDRTFIRNLSRTERAWNT